MTQREFHDENLDLMPSTGYKIGTWRDGVVGSGAPVNAVAITFQMRVGDLTSMLLAKKPKPDDELSVIVRIKSRRECSRVMAQLARYSLEMWPEEEA